MELVTAVAVGFLFAIGVFQMLRRNVIRSVIGLMILANAVNLFLLSTGAYDGLAAAYTTATDMRSDALPQALILTAVVISLGGTAFVLAMLYIISSRYQTADMDEVNGLKN
ncbi:MAG: NADH-quinone oxidoreductase subunit K [Chloroflexi bacterium]|nr:NADH-quinone oxidoreductase subunit K [Chloroflexota bacterium]MBK6713318.1 NADH-quinone oxidoreductase subunit K [Chloroflexota bacterium]MBK7176938.1 NADH-quinone oxidoreductase subunit K [Chloroflexota bacterium]MBK8933005.1 NADH-quinone oxidoreductase subunit K [Chloroflexota bacterium]MBP7591001.1 NADH-quinone oxidoreductase subunit K [Chloroflexota bacterium]